MKSTDITANLQLQLRSLESIWDESYKKLLCFQIWSEHHRVGQLLGCEPFLVRGQEKYPENHKLLVWLNEFIDETGLVNAHLGLTSSDVADNARLLQLHFSTNRLYTLTRHVFRLLLSHEVCRPGLTHGTPVAEVPIFGNFTLYSETLRFSSLQPKRMAGIIGTRREWPVGLLSGYDERFDWNRIGWGPKVDPVDAGRQGTGGLQELRFAQELAAHAAVMIQICKSVRVLHFMGILKTNDQTFSSSAPGKFNPLPFESAESMLYSIESASSALLRCLSDDLFEGTMNRNWSTDHELERIILTYARACLRICDGLLDCSFIPAFNPGYCLSEQLTCRVIAGETRPSAYVAIAKEEVAKRN